MMHTEQPPNFAVLLQLQVSACVADVCAGSPLCGQVSRSWAMSDRHLCLPVALAAGDAWYQPGGGGAH
jgi:hypothetical protein